MSCTTKPPAECSLDRRPSHIIKHVNPNNDISQSLHCTALSVYVYMQMHGINEILSFHAAAKLDFKKDYLSPPPPRTNLIDILSFVMWPHFDQ